MQVLKMFTKVLVVLAVMVSMAMAQANQALADDEYTFKDNIVFQGAAFECDDVVGLKIDGSGSGKLVEFKVIIDRKKQISEINVSEIDVDQTSAQKEKSEQGKYDFQQTFKKKVEIKVENVGATPILVSCKGKK